MISCASLVEEFIKYGLETHLDYMLIELANERVKRMQETASIISSSDYKKAK